MGRIFDKVGREDIGLCYDFVYNDMTPEQRQIVRRLIRYLPQKERAAMGRTYLTMSGWAIGSPFTARL